jgi:hypothetical protein
VSALADRPGVTLSDWAAFTAGDVIATQGYPALLALIRQADVVLLADERPVDIAVEGTTPITKLAGITSDPQVDRLETDVPTDQTEQDGSLDDPAVPIPQPGPTSSSSTFSVRSARQVQIWARVLANPQAAIEASVDGARVGTITPVTLGTGGFEWLQVATVHVGAGIHHVTLSAVPSSFGDSYEVEESRVLDPSCPGHRRGAAQPGARRPRESGRLFLRPGRRGQVVLARAGQESRAGRGALLLARRLDGSGRRRRRCYHHQRA